MNVDIEISKAMARLAIQEIRNELRQTLTLQHADAIVELLKQLEAANARIAELEAQVDDEGIVRTLAELGMQLDAMTADREALQGQLGTVRQQYATLKSNYDAVFDSRTESHRQLVDTQAQLESANARIAELEAQLAKPATIHEVIDDFGETVTAVTL